MKTIRARLVVSLAAAASAALAAGVPVLHSQGGPPAGPQTARQMAPVDLTGTWVSVVIEDWRLRMMPARKGDYDGIPMNAAARAAADAWDPAADEAAGQQCRGYAAPALMRLPGRARISWQDDSTLKIEYDTGQQTRLLRFGPPAPAGAERSWQGQSVAEWETLTVVLPRGGGGGFGGGGRGAPPADGGGGRGGAPPAGRGAGGPGGPGGPGRGRGGPQLSRSLKVVTTNLRAGYLRKNGVPYSENAVLTEYFDVRTERNGETWFTAVSIVDDPANLNGVFITSSDFKKEPDDSKWMPEPCSAR